MKKQETFLNEKKIKLHINKTEFNESQSYGVIISVCRSSEQEFPRRKMQVAGKKATNLIETLDCANLEM